MSEGGVTPEGEEYSGPINPDLKSAAENSIHDPEITLKAGELQHRLIGAMDRSLVIDQRKNEMYVKSDRKENVDILLTGFNKMLIDPHREGAAPDDLRVTVREAERLAEFVRLVNKMGTLNPDGSVNLNYRLENLNADYIKVPPKRP